MEFTNIEQEIINDFQFGLEFGVNELEFFSEIPKAFIRYLPENFFIDYSLDFTEHKPIPAKLGKKYLWSITLQNNSLHIQSSIWAETPFEAFEKFNLSWDLEESDVLIESQEVKIYLSAAYDTQFLNPAEPKTAKKLSLVKELFEIAQ